MAIEGITLTGILEIDAVLRQLPKKLNQKVLIAAYKKAARPTVKRAQALVPKKTGTLRRSIGTVQVRNPRFEATTRTGPRRGKGMSGGGYHAHLIERGVKGVKKRDKRGAPPRYRTGQRYRGDIQPRPFMQPAINSTITQVRASIKTEIGASLIRTMKRHLKTSYKAA